MHNQRTLDDDSNISWEGKEEENDNNNNNQMRIQSSEEDEDDLYTSTEKYYPTKVDKTSKKSSLKKYKKIQNCFSKRKN